MSYGNPFNDLIQNLRMSVLPREREFRNDEEIECLLYGLSLNFNQPLDQEN